MFVGANINVIDDESEQNKLDPASVNNFDAEEAQSAWQVIMSQVTNVHETLQSFRRML